MLTFVLLCHTIVNMDTRKGDKMNKKYYKTKKSAVDLCRAARRSPLYYGCFINVENTPFGYCVYCDYQIITYKDLKHFSEEE